MCVPRLAWWGPGGQDDGAGPDGSGPAPLPVGLSAAAGGGAGVAIAHRRGGVEAWSGECGLVVPAVAVRVQAELQHAEGLVLGGDDVRVAVVAVLGCEGVKGLATGADRDLRYPVLRVVLPRRVHRPEACVVVLVAVEDERRVRLVQQLPPGVAGEALDAVRAGSARVGDVGAGVGRGERWLVPVGDRAWLVVAGE